MARDTTQNPTNVQGLSMFQHTHGRSHASFIRQFQSKAHTKPGTLQARIKGVFGDGSEKASQQTFFEDVGFLRTYLPGETKTVQQYSCSCRYGIREPHQN